MKIFKHTTEAAAIYIFCAICTILPVDLASGFGGWIGRTIGPRLAASRKAIRNLNNSIPDLSQQEQKSIIKGMWDNLGRVIAEYPHLEYISNHRVKIDNLDGVKILATDSKPAVIIGAHMGNWEVCGAVSLTRANLPIHLIYRAPNNPWVSNLLDKYRSLNGRIPTIPKSGAGSRKIMKALKESEHVGLLIDQKYNEGIEALFFGRPAMTSSSFVQLSQKFKSPLVAVWVERLNGCHFKVTVTDPIPVFFDDGSKIPVENVVKTTHNMLEQQIIKNPAQWLWLHRRWKDTTTD